MSINDSIDPRFLFHVEDESLQFRVGESAHKSRELETVGDRRFANFGGSRIERDETRCSDGDDDEDDICVRTPGNNRSSVAAETNRESKNPGIFIHSVYLVQNFLSFDVLLQLSQTQDC